MTLEDFFTLTEMNNGLSAPDRVKELVGLMQKGKDCVINNVSDATRKYSSVARAIAGTENKDCLLLFVQLDGLIYMNKWLKDASDFRNKTSDSSVEDIIIDLLRAFTRIETDSDKLVTYGILMTVNDLLGHHNPKVRDMAKSLLDMWNKEKPRKAVPETEDIGKPDKAEDGVSERYAGENGNLGPSSGDIDASQGSLTSEIHQDIAKDAMLSRASESLKDEEIKKTSSDIAISDEDTSYSTNKKSFRDPVNANLDKLEPPVSCSEELPSTEACSVVGPQQDIRKEDINGSELDPTRTEELTQEMGRSLQMLDKKQDPEATLSKNDAGTLHPVIEPCDVKDVNAQEKDSVSEVSDCLKTSASKVYKKMNDDKSSDYDRNIMVFRMKGASEYDSNVLEVSNTSELKPKNFKGPGGLFQRIGNLGVVEGRKVEGYLTKDYDFSKQKKRKKDKVEGYLTKDYDFSKQNNRKKDHGIEMKSDFDLDYGFADPLELARLVANEVEREVEDRSELSCSSSDKETSSKLQWSESSHHSITGELSHAESSAAEVSTQPDVSLDPPTEEDQVTSARCLDPGSQEDRSPRVIEAAQVVAASTNEFLCHFDLNEDVSLENVEHQGDITSPPVSIVSASKVAAAPLMPVGPLQFEGTLGWKGSSATSAFRPASPRRIPQSDFALSAGGNNNTSRGKHSLVNIDLNLAESRDNKQIPVSCQLASLDYSAEASSRRSGRLEFDLNQISDDGLPPEQYPFHQRSGHHNQSYSSSSTKQPSLRNIDIDDQPTLANDLSSGHFYLKSSQSSSAPGHEKSNDSVISIMGMRVEVNRRDSSVKHVPLSNGRIPGPSIGFNLERPEGFLALGSPASYPHPHILGINGLPPGSSIPFSSPMYSSGGANPYMGDLREAPVVPQFFSSSAIPTAFTQPPYPFSMHAMPNANGVGLSRDGSHLNSGMYSEGSGRDLGSFRQLFNPPQPRHFDEHLKANSQPSTSLGIGVGGKRKEPENGWESYPFTHHQQSWR